ncbi:MAG: ABC transporter permease subunit, partial [Deltaproteobacteria bacterium]|nr:ABC transporter permease subunit [Deltaproteobacteria bacterium]
ILPSPCQVLQEMINPKWRWFPQNLTTTQQVMAGFVLAVVVGVLLGLVVSWNDTLNRTLMPILLFFNSMPKVAAAPLVLVWFGFGVLPNIVMSFVISFFPVLLNTARGVSEVPYEMGAIVGEFIASEKGLAALILQAQSYLETGAMVGALLWISIMAMVLFGLINLAERLLMPWAKIKETD